MLCPGGRFPHPARRTPQEGQHGVRPRAAPKGPQRRLPPCPYGPGAGAAHTSPGSGAERGGIGACSAARSLGLRGVPREVPACPASAACLPAGRGLYESRARGAILARVLRRGAGGAGLWRQANRQPPELLHPGSGHLPRRGPPVTLGLGRRRGRTVSGAG